MVDPDVALFGDLHELDFLHACGTGQRVRQFQFQMARYDFVADSYWGCCVDPAVVYQGAVLAAEVLGHPLSVHFGKRHVLARQPGIVRIAQLARA